MLLLYGGLSVILFVSLWQTEVSGKCHITLDIIVEWYIVRHSRKSFKRQNLSINVNKTFCELPYQTSCLIIQLNRGTTLAGKF